MKNRFLKSFMIINLLLTTFIFANITKTENKPKFDKGWWWYQEEIKVPDENITKKITYKLSPADKAKLDATKSTNRLLKTLVVELYKNRKLNEAIKEKLDYAFPNTTPKYGVNNKGEKCLANSSSDCFVMPVIAEGQRIPVLKNFLRNPSPENSKKWLKWQSTYFNHINKVSHGLRFAFLKGGSDVYQTATDYALGDNLFFSKSEDVRAVREAKVIASLKNKIAYLFFLGQNELYEKVTDSYKKIAGIKKTFIKEMPHVFVFPSKKALNKFKTVLADLKQQGYVDVVNFYEKQKVVVRADLYKTYNIRLTPSTVVFYEDKGKKYSQIITSGEFSSSRLRKGTINFLTYHDIISPKEFGADKNWNITENPIDSNLTKLPKAKAYKILDKNTSKGKK